MGDLSALSGPFDDDVLAQDVGAEAFDLRI
jgi:hypothetical protein